VLPGLGFSMENIIVHIQNDIITIEWSPQEKDEYIDAQFQRSMRLLTDGKLEPDFQDFIGYEETTESAMNLR